LGTPADMVRSGRWARQDPVTTRAAYGKALLRNPFRMKLYLLIGLAGALGAMARFFVTSVLMQAAGRGFPWGTLSVNVIGSALVGFLGIWLVARWQWPMEYRLAVLVGFLGAFTTMSAFSIDTLALLERQQWLAAFGYATGTVIICLLAARGGMLMAERLTS